MESNEQLCNIFEMLVSRLDTFEGKLDLLQKAARHEDSMRPVGKKFSGVALTGCCVGLIVHDKFNSDGVFEEKGDEDVLILESYHISAYEDNMLWCNEDHDLPLWVSILRDAWGPALYQKVAETMTEHYNTKERSTPPTCKELGVVSGYENIQAEAFEVIMKKLVPGLLAIGIGFIAVQSSDLRNAVSVVNRVLHSAGSEPLDSLHNAILDVFHIPGHLGNFALAFMREYGVKEAYSAIDPCDIGLLGLSFVPFFEVNREHIAEFLK